MTRVSRRQFLAGATATAAAIAVPGLASAATPPAWSPDHITSVGDDLEQLRTYQPYLDATREDRQKMVGCYGWYADSDKHNTRAYYYWIKYPSQDSLFDAFPVLGGLFSKDAHFKDHEPFICYTDPDTGEVQDVVYSGYHHYAVQLMADEATLVQDRADFPSHMSLRVETPHHHYSHQRDETKGVPAHTIVGDNSFGSFLDKQSAWEKNEVFSSSHKPAVFDPWVIRDRGTW